MEASVAGPVIADGHAGGARPLRPALRAVPVRRAGPRRAAARRPAPGQLPACCADGRLGVLDFGAVARLPDGLPEPIGRLLRARRRRRGRPCSKACATRASSSRRSTSTPSAARLPRPVRRAGRVDSSRSAGPGCASSPLRVSDPRRRASAPALKLNLPPEYLLIHRVWLGGIGVLCQLGATPPFRAILEESLPGFAEG